MRTLVLATRNRGKIREIERILTDLPIRLVSLSEYGDAPTVVEDGTSYLENARKKAVVQAHHTGEWAMGEDSGIEVDALDGAPGIYSARYSGDPASRPGDAPGGASDLSNNRKLLAGLEGVPEEKRTARYRCVVVVADPSGTEIATAEGTCEGRVGREERGTSGFGYDPLFVVPEFSGQTMAELGPEIKNRISHRARALAELREKLGAKLASGSDGP